MLAQFILANSQWLARVCLGVPFTEMLLDEFDIFCSIIGILQRNGDDQKLIKKKLPQLSKNYNSTDKQITCFKVNLLFSLGENVAIRLDKGKRWRAERFGVGSRMEPQAAGGIAFFKDFCTHV